MTKTFSYLTLGLLVLLASCRQGSSNDSTTAESASNNENRMKPTITEAPFGTTPRGEAVTVYTLTNGNGLRARIMNYGATLISLEVPDAHGKLADVVLGYDSFPPYLTDNPYFGSTVGRYANRIGGAAFTLDGKRYELAKNDGPNHLHGGIEGFDKKIWGVQMLPHVNAEDCPTRQPGVGLQCWYRSPDGEEGYPGELLAQVTYFLTDADELVIYYAARTTKPTVVNLTHHSYFNLGGGRSDVLDHVLSIQASRFLPVDATLIPTGELRPVDDTPMDFRSPKPIGQDIDADDAQLRIAQGFDHCWVLDRDPEAHPLQLAAEVFHPHSGRRMRVLTTEPGMQFYSGNFLDGRYTGKGGTVYQDRWGFCLETQHFPDSPNKPHFPSTVLRPGQTYRSTTVYAFSN